MGQDGLAQQSRDQRFHVDGQTFQGCVLLSGELHFPASEVWVMVVARVVDDVRDVRSSIQVAP